MPIQPVSGEIKAQPLNDNFSFLDSQIMNVNGGPFGSYESLKDLNTQYPNGRQGFAVIGGYSYWWINSLWTKGNLYQAADYKEVRAETLQKDMSLVELLKLEYKSGRMGNDGKIVTSEYSHYKVVDASFGDIFLISTKGLQANTYPYVIIDRKGAVVEFRQRADETLTDFEVVAPKESYKMYVNGPIDVPITIKKYQTFDVSKINKYFDVYDANYTELFSGAVSFGSSSISLTDNIYSVKVTAKNQGLVTNGFDSDSTSTQIKLRGSKDLDTLDVFFGYLDSTGTAWKYKKLGTIIDNTFDVVYTFDATYYKIYNNAEQFRFLVQCNDDSPNGTFSLTAPNIYALSEFQTRSVYAQKLDEMLNKLANKTDELSDSINTLATTKPTLSDSDGNKYFLTVENGDIKLVRTIPKNILFMGNSLLLGLDTDGTRGGAFGMCASDHQHDYAYIVEQEVLSKNSNATFIKLHDAAFEQAETAAAAQTYISNNATSFTADLDLVILQIGDNVNSDVRRSVFEVALPDLINTIKTKSPNSRILLVGCWFDSNNLVTTILKSVANQTGTEYISIRGLYTSENMATIGDIITYKDGSTKEVPASYASHPGNSGMQAIAEAIISKIGI